MRWTWLWFLILSLTLTGAWLASDAWWRAPTDHALWPELVDAPDAVQAHLNSRQAWVSSSWGGPESDGPDMGLPARAYWYGGKLFVRAEGVPK
jgi:hypothetical protein